MPHHPLVEGCIESLCQQGCRKVWGHIEALQNGAELPEIRGLNALQVRVVLDELKAVMAVYGDRCSLDA